MHIRTALIRSAALSLVAAVVMLVPPGAHAQVPTRQQQNCVIAVNKVGVKLASVQGRTNQSCIKDAGKGGAEQTVAECMSDPDNGKIDRLLGRLATAENNKCKPPLPPFGYTGGDTVVTTALEGEKQVIDALFGTPVDPAIVLRDEDFDGVRCQLGMLKVCAQYSATRLKEFKNCKKAGMKDGTIASAADLSTCVVADPRGKIEDAAQDLASSIDSRCEGADLPALFPGVCSGVGNDPQLFGPCLESLVNCQTCLTENDMDGLLFDCDTLDDGFANGSCRTCGNGVTEAPEICDDGGETSTCDVDCTLPLCGDGLWNPSTGEECDDGNGVDGDGCDMGCILSACGNGVIGIDEECDDGNNGDGDGCTSLCACEPGAAVLGCHDPSCPDTVELIHLAKAGPPCVDNADCVAGICDPTLQRCITETIDDLGFTGIVHETDYTDASARRLRMSCPGPGPTCGECFIAGIDSSAGNCRCADDNRQICHSPLKPDVENCGGGFCDCYDAPPSPNSTGNTPVCMLWRHSADISGTLNVDTGEAVLSNELRVLVHFGEALVYPCPTCDGDDNPDDGKRNGTCTYGPNAGQTCDANAYHPTFPLPAGGFHSYDCFPDPGKNISAEGVLVRADLTTGTSRLESNVECGISAAPDLCPCGVCSGAPGLVCTSNADCTGLGTCGRLSEGVPVSNICGDGICSDTGGGEGKCETASGEINFCDGVLKADGLPFVQCISDADCDAADCGSASCGTCSLSDKPRCFLDEIETVGTADPVAPVHAAAYCIPPSTGAASGVVGLPGPGRIVRQELASYSCTNDPSTEYVPGVGGCP